MHSKCSLSSGSKYNFTLSQQPNIQLDLLIFSKVVSRPLHLRTVLYPSGSGTPTARVSSSPKTHQVANLRKTFFHRHIKYRGRVSYRYLTRKWMDRIVMRIFLLSEKRCILLFFCSYERSFFFAPSHHKYFPVSECTYLGAKISYRSWHLNFGFRHVFSRFSLLPPSLF